MGWLSLAGLFIRAVLLVMQWMRDREVAGAAKAEALKELTDAINDRVNKVAAARAAPHDDSVHDVNQRD